MVVVPEEFAFAVFVLTPVLKSMVPLRFSPRTTALKVPVVWKKVPFPKGLPFLLEAPAWRVGAKARVVPRRRRAREGILERFMSFKDHLTSTLLSTRFTLITSDIKKTSNHS